MMRYLNVGCGRDIRHDETAEWVNMDYYFEHPNVLKWNFLKLPWPFPDNHFDAVLARHVMEHVPHIYDENGRDVIFAIMEEVARVVKPNRFFSVIVPYGHDPEIAFCHPQHYRYWTESWFKYFAPGEGENYYSTARFDVMYWKLNRWGHRWPNLLKIGKYGLTVHLAARVPPLRPLLVTARELEAVLINRK